MFVMLLLVVQYRPELSEQSRHKTDTIDTSARTRVRVSTDKCLRQLGHVRKKQIFLNFVLHCDSFALWCIVVKNKTKQILEFEEA